MPYIEMNEQRIGQILELIAPIKQKIVELDEKQKNDLLFELIKVYEEPLNNPNGNDFESILESKSFFELLSNLTK